MRVVIEMTVHYRNLTRGLLCSHPAPGARMVRIQSTWCEQKRWQDILLTLDSDLLYNLAQGQHCVIHDVSERDRESRAMWQGLSWIRAACFMAWREWSPPREYSRSGMDVSGYWFGEYISLPGRIKTYLKYFRQWDAGKPLQLESCWGLP